MQIEIYQKILNDIKDAMKAHDNIRRDCLRNIVAEIKNQTVNAGKELTEAICMNVLKKAVKQHNDSILNFKNGNRQDLVEKEKLELNIINQEETIQELLKYKYLVKALEEVSGGHYIEEIISDYSDGAVSDEKEQLELNIISQYLPKMFSNENIITIINNVIEENKIDLNKNNFGKIMKLLNTLPNNNLIDRKFVSQYLKTILY